jgi:hypothetical protein
MGEQQLRSERCLILVVRRKHPPVQIVTAVLGRIRVIAWSTNLQSSWGVSRELRNQLAKRVAALARIR